MKKFGSFSDAIRFGATLSPQGKGVYFNEETGATCAFGAGMQAILGAGRCESGMCSEMYPYLNNIAGPCPACGFLSQAAISSMIFHLNDEHLWTRERIAGWLQEREDELGFVTLSVTEESQATLNLKAELSDLGETLKEVSVSAG